MADWAEEKADHLLSRLNIQWSVAARNVVLAAIREAAQRGMERAAAIIEGNRVVWCSKAPHHRIEPNTLGEPPDTMQRTYAVAIRAASKEDE